MNFGQGQLAAAAAAGVLTLTLALGPAQAQDKTFVMKITTPTIHAVLDEYGKAFGEAVEKDSGGRIKFQLYPASQLGTIPRQIEGTQFGAIQCAIIPPEFFVGIDERFEVLAAPGLVTSAAQAEKIAADPEVRKFYLALGANKGLHGVAVGYAEESEVVSKDAIRHLSDFKGKKIRIFASEFQSKSFSKLGATPVAMSPGDVVAALQQGALDSSIAGVQLLSGLHFFDAAKYITMTNHAAIFYVVEISKKWYDSLPPDLQQIVDRDASTTAINFSPRQKEIEDASVKAWTAGKGEFINLPADEQAEMIKTMSSVGAEVSKSKPGVAEAFKLVSDAAERDK
ncbi:MAG TPA: TRAP transporter substrate-binding protein [Xanthobacteraceae bacterium]|nr:TRAP transporter substrate-binding protein [Xanthobacteraceae bacterium]